LALAITVIVYGLVAGIVKLDDGGLYLLRKSMSSTLNIIQSNVGGDLLIFAPLLMKILSIVGTAAMILVGDGILAHSVSFIHHLLKLTLYSVELIQVVSSAVPVFLIVLLALLLVCQFY
jgi:hypothetical protein